MRTRIAPTPSGFLHEGNLINFLMTDHLCRKAGGSLRLRIDDLDSHRVRKEYVDDVFNKLEALSIPIDLGPKNTDEHFRRFRQQDRVGIYMQAISRLSQDGHLYACSCSRSQIHEDSPSGKYPGTCRDKGLPLDAPGMVLRLRIDAPLMKVHEWGGGVIDVDLTETIPDPVIRRKDGLPAYQIASLCDDLEHGINFIVRGEDLIPSTAVQLILAKKLGFEDFGRVAFLHHGLLTETTGEKLSKSAGAKGEEMSVDAGLLREKTLRLLEDYLRAT